jgi:hypothetical protein
MRFAGIPSVGGTERLRGRTQRTTLSGMFLAGGPRPSSPRFSRWIAAASRLSLLVVLAFHAWRLVARALDGQLFEPGVALRWAVGVALLAALVGLRRLGIPILHGRKAAVLWTLVFLLHCHAAVAPPLTPSGRPMVPQTAEVIATYSATPLLLVAGALLLALAFRRAIQSLRLVAHRAIGVGPIGTPALAHLTCLAPRPPPA